MVFPTNPALEAAVVAAADDDTPRLVYADWLDENGDPDRAEFIRVQCRLADLSPAEPDWVDLTERELELSARLQDRKPHLMPPEFERFDVGSEFLDPYIPRFRRGFPFFVDCRASGSDWTEAVVSRVAADLTRLMATTAVRGFTIADVIPARRVGTLLTAIGPARLRGLSIAVSDYARYGVAGFFRTVATHPAVDRVHTLGLRHGTQGPELDILAAAESLGEVRRLTLPVWPVETGSPDQAALGRLVAADWFRRLTYFCGDFQPGGEPLVAGLSTLTDLHTLELNMCYPGLLGGMNGVTLPALARLWCRTGFPASEAVALAGCRFPSLTVFEADLVWLTNDGLAGLMRADWWGKLRVLDIRRNALGDRVVAALTRHPVAKRLRILRLGGNRFGKIGLTALVKPGALPMLSTLDLGFHSPGKAVEADVAKFLGAWTSPSLRHLDLHGLPVGDSGAKALATNSAFAGLTRLNLKGCRIGASGGEALFHSPHLQNLIELDTSGNDFGAADALSDPDVMPGLVEWWRRLSRSR